MKNSNCNHKPIHLNEIIPTTFKDGSNHFKLVCTQCGFKYHLNKEDSETLIDLQNKSGITEMLTERRDLINLLEATTSSQASEVLASITKANELLSLRGETWNTIIRQIEDPLDNQEPLIRTQRKMIDKLSSLHTEDINDGTRKFISSLGRWVSRGKPLTDSQAKHLERIHASYFGESI